MSSRKTMHTATVEISYEAFGQGDDPVILLVMGNSAPGLVWPDAFCERLASARFRVIRFDQRDTGLSTFVEFDAAPYTLDDLARDAFSLLDCAGARQAMVVGMSQGGDIAYRMALQHPERISGLGILMSSADLRPKNDAFAGAPVRPGELPRPAEEYVRKVIALNAKPPSGEAEMAQRFVDNFRLAAGPRSSFDEDAWRKLGKAFAGQLALRADALTPALANNSNHARAQKATPSLSEAQLSSITSSVIIVHGSDDPIFPVEHARWAAGILGDARLQVIEGMGHALDHAYFALLVELLRTFSRTVRRT